jgi:hypothetical protein
MHKNATKCNKIQSKWCINKHGASKIIDTFETYHPRSHGSASGTKLLTADKGLLLLRLTSDVKLGEDETDKYPYQQDYFTCDCKSIASISLRRLPVCTEPIVLRVGNKNRTLDCLFHPDTIGLCRLGSDEFAVVQLANFFVGAKGKMGAELCLLRSALWNDWRC